LLDQVEVLNVSCEKREESLLSFTLEEVLAVNIVNETAAIAVIGDEMDRVLDIKLWYQKVLKSDRRC